MYQSFAAGAADFCGSRISSGGELAVLDGLYPHNPFECCGSPIRPRNEAFHQFPPQNHNSGTAFSHSQGSEADMPSPRLHVRFTPAGGL
jgi:hypothetical protein